MGQVFSSTTGRGCELVANNTQSRLVKVLSQVEGWAQDNWPPNGWLKQYLSQEIDRPGLAADDLYAFGMLACSQGLLEAKMGDTSEAIKQMTFGFARRGVACAVRIQRLKGTGRIAIQDLDGLTDLMLGTMALGRPDVSKILYHTAIAGIEGGYGVHDGHDLEIGTTLRYSGFGLSIISNWIGEPLDLDKHALPRDPAWAPLVSQWRDPDPNKVLSALLVACDVHLSRIAVTHREHETIPEEFEFSTPLLAVHPTEILAVLRLRDLLGLPNPAQIDHPLMQTPYAQLTCTPAFLSSHGVRDELLENFLDTVRRRHPDVIPDGL